MNDRECNNAIYNSEFLKNMSAAQIFKQTVLTERKILVWKGEGVQHDEPEWWDDCGRLGFVCLGVRQRVTLVRPPTWCVN